MERDYRIYLSRRTFLPSDDTLVPPSDTPAYYFIQFTKALTLEERQLFRSRHGLRFDKYVPNFAYLEQLTFQKWFALSKEPLYRASALYEREDKIAPEIGSLEFRSEERRNMEGILIRAFLFSETTDAAISDLIKFINSQLTARKAMQTNLTEPRAAGKPTGRKMARKSGAAKNSSLNWSDMTEVRLLDDRKLGGDLQLVFVAPSAEMLPQLTQRQEVQWIEEVAEPSVDACSQKNHVAGTIQSGNPGLTPIWRQEINGRDQIIGIIDQKLINLEHCMFMDGTRAPIGVSHRKLVGFRIGNGQTDAHGTRVAGIAAGDDFQNPGLNRNRGIAFAARLSFDDLTIIRQIGKSMFAVLTDECRDGAKIHSNSWNDNTRAYNGTAKDVDAFAWGNEDNLICGASANSDPIERLGPPGTAKNTLCVSAGGRHPNHLRHADGQSGPTRDGRRKPEICAPGCQITSASVDRGCSCTTPSSCATSWATPVIAGAAALVRQYYMEGFHPTGVRELTNPLTPPPSAALIKATLLNSTVPMIRVDGDPGYPNGRTGWGLVKLDETLFFAGGPRNLFIKDVRNASGLDTGQSTPYSITVKGSSQALKITLVWTDPPAELYAGKALVNDLDLVVTSPDRAEIYRGNTNFVGGFSQPQASLAPDDPNNVEMVIVEKPAEGAWTITVEGRAVHVGRQGYALVITGSLG